MRTERELLVDGLERLNRLGRPYMLVGSMASNFWGIPRSTHDLDFVLGLTPGDVHALAEAFCEGFFLQPDSIRRAFDPPYQFNAIDERSALKVDFWMVRDDPFEQTAFERRTRVELFGTPAWIATGEELILHKLFWHRITPSDRQLGDAAGIFAVQAATLDLAYLRDWADRLGVAPGWAAILSGSRRPKST